MIADEVVLETVAPTGGRARAVLRASMVDVTSRYHRRPATPAEVDAALTAAPADDLVLPGGLLVVATGTDGTTLGCAGLRLLPDGVGDLVEARRLYARLGYVEVVPFDAGPYADHWLAKDLPPCPERPDPDEERS